MNTFIDTDLQGTTRQNGDAIEQASKVSEARSTLVVHSASGHSGTTTICRSLVRDLPFDVYISCHATACTSPRAHCWPGHCPLRGGIQDVSASRSALPG